MKSTLAEPSPEDYIIEVKIKCLKSKLGKHSKFQIETSKCDDYGFIVYKINLTKLNLSLSVSNVLEIKDCRANENDKLDNPDSNSFP
ncbi:hypothetical protein AYI70_g3619 [Smittium culicis]|uniref:Uncharacterized protein n=1 Tax=Smittium culicis TaxID=133412 RepID=A0A1R1Y2K3_9FUNG|nr:hypothetical protein AYI70_g3619 [Smittium culicis]